MTPQLLLEARLKTKGVVELQREQIERLEKHAMDLANQLQEKIQVIGDLSQVLAHLTDDKFKDFINDDNNWNKVITEYLETR